ncbi:MAG: copper-binding protein [Tepidimonas fonticaldi]|nr:copper-binding protein [Tepidimonas fonticaldi]
MRRIDTAARKITLRHGDIPDLDMPPMTMVFQVRDPALLQGLQTGARVRFRAQKADGAYIVTDIKAAP